MPWRQTRAPYAVWTSEIMLQQTQVKTVIPYWLRWMDALPNLAALAAASPATIHKLWEGLGYYIRVRNMQRAARLILTEHGGRFPTTSDKLRALPGIGRYTAGAICSIAYHQPEPILDGNVARVLARLFAIDSRLGENGTTQTLWTLADELVTTAANGRDRNPACSLLNQGLMELGALICTARDPDCQHCPVRRSCAAVKQRRVHELPRPAARPLPTARRFLAFVLEQNGSLLLRQRPAGVVNAHLWEFPNVEVNGKNGSPLHAARSLFGTAIHKPMPLCCIKHSITRYRITLEALRISTPAALIHPPSTEWISKDNADTLAFCSAHKKLLSKVLHKRK